MKVDKKDTKTKNTYKPNSTLTKYLNEKLQLSKLEHYHKHAGGELPDDYQEKKERNQRMRVHVLNRHVFESMANIVKFFEFVSGNALLEEFEDDIRELLAGRKHVTDATMFVRLVDSMLSWNCEHDVHNFRVSLLSHAVTRMHYTAKRVSRPIFGNSITDNIIEDDLLRALAWSQALAQRKDVDRAIKPERYHRPVLF